MKEIPSADEQPRPNTEQLLAEARQGQRESLGALLESYRAYLHTMARTEIGARLQARANPSDVVQETFLQASRHFGQFDGHTEAEWRSWLRSILRRRLLHLVRKQVLAGKRSVQREVPLPPDPTESGSTGANAQAGLASTGSSPSLQARRNEAADTLARQLARLPAQYREVLVLRNLQGLPFDEVARRMGRTPGAVRVLWVRALERLRQEHGNEDAT